MSKDARVGLSRGSGESARRAVERPAAGREVTPKQARLLDDALTDLDQAALYLCAGHGKDKLAKEVGKVGTRLYMKARKKMQRARRILAPLMNKQEVTR